MIKELIKIANNLDKKGFQREASVLDSILQRNMGELKKLAGHEIPAWEAMSHEDHSPIEESAGFTEFEAEEDYRKDLNNSAEVAELILRGTPIMGEDAEEMVRELAEILTDEKHLPTVEAIIGYLNNPDGGT